MENHTVLEHFSFSTVEIKYSLCNTLNIIFMRPAWENEIFFLVYINLKERNPFSFGTFVLFK